VKFGSSGRTVEKVRILKYYNVVEIPVFDGLASRWLDRYGYSEKENGRTTIKILSRPTDLLLSALSRSDAAADNADAQHRFFWAQGDVNQSIMLF